MKQDSLEESSVTDAEEFLKPDELVNCICDFQEENGLMIQVYTCTVLRVYIHLKLSWEIMKLQFQKI
jgi:hypothetical protein